ncbi:MAG: hypothetical protein COT71_02695 [Candidatus Andersenbacteria bacterium CG10_big_fil_rev_8_21_14_0_10_54_11]|uniref:Uncharacterized protein n=1 Tax=Candidatus Andersenbacteria bacterium CG10_big_fil_rev_8_21_14_0_10_54_11 TaxID=1974485 RepID=A0A2M6WZ59_9BACT|nr:MAG: hypothetical protein COT71_02695 [Candidatus Andersenbacteria bacterium CG10_big_fil_rev_8_21_14_0_10_54_11]
MSDVLLSTFVLLLALLALVVSMRLLRIFLHRRADPPSPAHKPSAAADAVGVVAAAKVQAEKIIRGADLITRRTEQDLKKTLQHQAETAARAAEERLQDMTNMLQKTVEQHLASYTKQLAKHTTAMEDELKRISEKERTRLRKEISAYQQRRVSALEQEIIDSLPGIISRAAGRSIPLVEHEKMVSEALKRASESGWNL